MDILYVKALHVIFVVTWFAALFYIVRLFIYHAEAEEKEEVEKNILQKQYQLMERRLWYIIGWPSAVLTIVFGIWMLVLQPIFLKQPWMHLKLSLVFGLLLYHVQCHRIFKQLQNNIVKWKSTKLRFWNELATLFLFAIVFVVILKSLDNWYWGVVGLLLFGSLMMLTVKWYKKLRGKKNNS